MVLDMQPDMFIKWVSHACQQTYPDTYWDVHQHPTKAVWVIRGTNKDGYWCEEAIPVEAVETEVDSILVVGEAITQIAVMLGLQDVPASIIPEVCETKLETELETEFAPDNDTDDPCPECRRDWYDCDC